jgi:hypothetical protein
MAATEAGDAPDVVAADAVSWQALVGDRCAAHAYTAGASSICSTVAIKSNPANRRRGIPISYPSANGKSRVTG